MCERTPEYEEIFKQSKPFENQAEWKEMVKSLRKDIPTSAWTINEPLCEPIPAKKFEVAEPIVFAPYVPIEFMKITIQLVETDERKYNRAMEVIKDEQRC